MDLFDLVKTEGYTLEIDPNAADRADIKGLPQRDELCAQACEGNVIAIRPSVPEAVRIYPVSHEIAEDRQGFTGHHQGVWREQLAIVCRWVRRLLEENAKLREERAKESRRANEAEARVHSNALALSAEARQQRDEAVAYHREEAAKLRAEVAQLKEALAEAERERVEAQAYRNAYQQADALARGHREEVERHRAETGRLRFERDTAKADLKRAIGRELMFQAGCEVAKRKISRLRAAIIRLKKKEA